MVKTESIPWVLTLQKMSEQSYYLMITLNRKNQSDRFTRSLWTVIFVINKTIQVVFCRDGRVRICSVCSFIIREGPISFFFLIVQENWFCSSQIIVFLIFCCSWYIVPSVKKRSFFFQNLLKNYFVHQNDDSFFQVCSYGWKWLVFCFVFVFKKR